MLIDLILLVLIVSIFAVFLSQHLNQQSINTASLRSQSAFTQKLLISTLEYKLEDNTTIASSIEMSYCGKDISTEENIKSTITALNKPNYHYIFIAYPNGKTAHATAVCDDYVSQEYGCCVKTDKVNIATVNLSLPSGCNYNYILVTLGVWPDSMEVDKCD